MIRSIKHKSFVKGMKDYTVSYYSTHNNDDLFMKSVIPTNFFQKHLMKLPIPKLNDSLKLYQSSQAAILDDKSMQNTKENIKSFATKEGPLLHSYLKKFAKENKHTNYVNIFWTDRYLRDRNPVVLTHNPTLIFKHPRKASGNAGQSIRTTNLIWSSVRFLRSLRMNIMEPAIFHMKPEKTNTEQFKKFLSKLPPVIAYYYSLIKKVFPLDNSQLINYLFSTSRIPEFEKDKIVHYDNANHILILHKGEMYTFDVLNQQGGGINPNQILSNIMFILSQNPTTGYNDPGLGSLTTMNRDKWAEARKRLLSLGNQGALEKIDSAIFAIALDSDSYDNEYDLIVNTLHGPSENRWFDKSFSLIIDNQGETAVNMEHSWGDGMAMINYIDAVYNDSENKPYFPQKLSSDDISKLPSPKVDKLVFQLDASITEDILPKARKEYNHRRDQVELNLSKCTKFGNQAITEAKFNKDSLLQLSFQMAYYKMHGKQAPTYESASSIVYKDGRTETLRPATIQTKAFCEMMTSQPDNTTELYELLRTCAKAHNALIVKCSTGKGWDRHLFGLLQMAKMNGFDPLPRLYSDPAYMYINDIIISTSTVPSSAIAGGAFAAVTDHGYGLGYGTRETECGCLVTSWKDNRESNGRQFTEAHNESLNQLATIIDYAKKKSTSN